MNFKVSLCHSSDKMCDDILLINVQLRLHVPEVLQLCMLIPSTEIEAWKVLESQQLPTAHRPSLTPSPPSNCGKQEKYKHSSN